MTLSMLAHRDDMGLKDGLLLVGGQWARSIGINGYQVEPHLPFGGYKQSGIGREGGRSAYEAYTELKSIVMPLSEGMM